MCAPGVFWDSLEGFANAWEGPLGRVGGHLRLVLVSLGVLGTSLEALKGCLGISRPSWDAFGVCFGLFWGLEDLVSMSFR